jgi:hypothetical protein
MLFKSLISSRSATRVATMSPIIGLLAASLPRHLVALGESYTPLNSISRDTRLLPSLLSGRNRVITDGLTGIAAD